MRLSGAGGIDSILDASQTTEETAHDPLAVGFVSHSAGPEQTRRGSMQRTTTTTESQIEMKFHRTLRDLLICHHGPCSATTAAASSEEVTVRVPHQDVSLPPSGSFVLDFSTPGPTVETLLAFFGGMLAILIILVILAFLWKCIRPGALQKMVRSSKSLPVTDLSSDNLRTISYFSYRTLKKATANFHITNHLGRGGFGVVYKGVLDDRRMIAVKQLCLGKSSQGESEFLAEVRLITSIQHRNLVRLVGCCSEGAEKLLVYEYMENGSLDNVIYGKNTMFLSWESRFRIILGIARGLQYLHEESNLRIVHRDIKASNILLDDKFHPKISDFGLARFFPEDQAYLSTTVAGTLGYTAPEYAIRGELSEKADIYSFGVLALEIISCRKNTDLTLSSDMQYLPEYAWKLYERSKIVDLVDPKLQADEVAEREILQVCQIALLCLQAHPNLRPPMSEIVAMLTCKTELIATPMNPAFWDRNHKINRNPSWDSLSENHSAPLRSESLSS